MNYKTVKPVMTRREGWFYTFLVVSWLISVLYFWIWWLNPSNIISSYGLIVNSLLVSWTMLMPGYYFYFVSKMKEPTFPKTLPKKWRVAMIVTKAPAEPLSMVKKTLLAMISQKYPHDTWVADEDPTIEAIAWYEKHNVKLSTRKGVPDYHQNSWPRRTKCKEGNLAYFYDKFGYSQYDIVCQLDADHVPQKDYLEHMISPFVEEDVGYVAGPSICDANIDVSWVVRARMYAEATMHGSLQAGYNSEGWAPLCIGSHYAVRTVALRQIGGIGPELAEDHTTTLMMNSNGWRGVFAFNAIARGDGATNFSDSMLQEFQWSKSLVIVLLSITKKYWNGLTPKLKFQFAFSQLWYPLFAFCMLTSYLLPLIAIIRGQPWVNVNYLEFVLHNFLSSSICILIVWWISSKGWLRPKYAKFISWETILFQLARWPWVLIACISAIICVVFKREFKIKVTPKSSTVTTLPIKITTPYFILTALPIIVICLSKDTPSNRGYFYLALTSAFSYGLLLININWLHIKNILRDGEKIRIIDWWPQFYLGSFAAFLLFFGAYQRGQTAILATFFSASPDYYLASSYSANLTKQPKNSQKLKIYTIKSGDNLWNLSVKEYQNGSCWKEVHKVNQDKIKSTSSIKIGTKILLPNINGNISAFCK
ncbi:glycosyltransferase [Candidatus Shapirobacteria bacterium]|nr:glycosyltransferase [Candidatus Shapirobacteria bacterium]